MTPEAQRTAIAEWCGWHLHERHRGLELPLNLQCWTNDKEERFGNYLPDYLSDLNAVQVVLSNLSIEDGALYVLKLWQVVIGSDTDLMRGCIYEEDIFRVLTATASQRCEALLRTIGKWRDE